MDGVLSRFGWLPHCSPEFRAFVLSSVRQARVAAGQTISFAGDADGGMYAIVEGQAAYLMVTGDGGTSLGHCLYPGHWWGQAPLIGGPRNGYAVARTTLMIAILPLPLLRQRLTQVPGDWEALALTYGDAFRMASGAHADMLIPGHSRRLAALLLRLGGNRHRRFPVDVPHSFVCTQEELAGALGLSRNSTGRLLRGLESRRLVEARYGRIRILDAEGLEALVEAE